MTRWGAARFYKHAVAEVLLEHSAETHVHSPRLDHDSHAALDRNELGAIMLELAGGGTLCLPADRI